MLEIVVSKDDPRPDYEMAERIRYNTVLQGLLAICVKNYMRISPPLIVTIEEIDEIVGRLESAIQRAIDGHPRDLDFSVSSSLAASKVAAE
jgi:4-aminobutyrate aminotransferase-like enzyme